MVGMDTVLLDSYVFLDVFLNSDKSSRAQAYLMRLKKGEIHAVASSIAVLEVKYHLIRKLGHGRAEEAVYILRSFTNLEIIPLDEAIAETAADLRVKYYDKQKRPLSFADCAHIATAIRKGCSRILSGDGDFAKLEEIKTEIY